MLRTIFSSCLLGCALVAADNYENVEIRDVTDLAEATDGDYVSGGRLKEMKLDGKT